MEPSPLILNDATKHYCHDQDKIMAPEQTVQNFKARLAENRLDIMDDIVRIDNGRLGIPVYFSICGPQARETIGNYKQMGKGATPAQAQASAVMELGERFSLFSFVKNRRNFIVGTQKALGEPTMDFSQIARSVTEDTSDDLTILEGFFSEMPLQWTWAHDLTNGRTVLIPFNWFWTINEFNGASAGNCNEEALCQGICEVVERHVCALVSRRKLEVPRITVDSIGDPVARELIAKYRKEGIELYLSDFSMDMGIPSVAVLAWDPTTFPGKSEIVWTAGTMPSPAKALCRALTEVAQLAGDFNTGGNYVASGLPKFQSMEAARYVTEAINRVSMETLPEIGHPNIKVEVENCIQALAKRDMTVFAVDVRHAALGIPAFYTIVPGAQFRERAAHSSVGMIMAKIITQTSTASDALLQLQRLENFLPGKYFLKFYQGQIHLNHENYEPAAELLKAALDLTPPPEDRATILTYLGICHKETGCYLDALHVLEKAHEIDPERTDTLNLIGFCHFKLKDHEKAIAAFEKLLVLDPSSAIDYANIGANYRAMGKNTKAIEYYRLALTLDPGIEFARDHLANMGVEE